MTVHFAPVIAPGVMFKSKVIEARRWLFKMVRESNAGKGGNSDKIVVYRHRAGCHRLCGVGSWHGSERITLSWRGILRSQVLETGIKNDVI
jgi:hypothetical protein